MKYVAVLSSQPGADVYKPIFNYFEDYLITLGEPTTSPAWNLMSIVKHANKIINKEKLGEDQLLMIDSGGFQAITGKIPVNRLVEYTDCYHDVIIRFHEKLHKIFSLDLNNINFSEATIKYYNDYSLDESIKLLKKYPDMIEKQLFVIQSRNTFIFKIWKDIMLKHTVFDHYKLWSIGGLVNLKKETNANFSHAVPITLWLLAYAKKYNGEIKQVHWLGQSSRLAFIGMALFEKIYGINMTADSSQLIRFAPIEHKMPFMYFDKDLNDFILAQDHDSIEKMLSNHSLGKTHADTAVKKFRNYTFNNESFETDHDEEEFTDEEQLVMFNKSVNKLKANKNNFSMDNEDVIELQSQNIFYEIQFANMIVEKLLKFDITHWNADNLKEVHPILARGRIAKELANNLSFFIKFKPVIENMDLDEADKIMIDVTESYSKHLEVI